MQAARVTGRRDVRPRGGVESGVWVLSGVLLVEMAVFSAIAPHFLTIANFFEVARFSIELGLLATALTPIVITGGIDL